MAPPVHSVFAHPPARLCHACQDAWAAWGSANLPPSMLDGGGEGRRLQIIADRRADIENRCAASAHDRYWRPTPAPAPDPAPPAPTSLLGARAAGLLDAFEALLPADGRTREEKLAAAVQRERDDQARWVRTRQPWQPTPIEPEEGVA